MRSAISTLAWELVWKHRLIVPALGVFLVVGMGLGAAVGAHGAERPWWLSYARGVFLFSFVSSLLLGYAPFTLMETHSGWRTNSMVTRWFTLPVRTWTLVSLPVAAAAGLIAMVFLAWAPWLERLAGSGLDRRYVLATLVLGVVLLQAVAWSLPRRPAQYWAIAGLVLPLTLLVALIPLERPNYAVWRARAAVWYLAGSAILGLWAYYAARRNRCGDWPGYLPTEQIVAWLRRPRSSCRAFPSARSAFFASEVVPSVRSLGWSWVLMAFVVLAWAMLVHRAAHAGGPRSWEIAAYAMAVVMPFVAPLWLAGWGLTLGNRPGSGFRTPLTSFHATLPVTAGELALPRLRALWTGWWMVWLPLVVLAGLGLPQLRGVWDYDGLEALQGALVWRMALSASLVAGALPLLLAGKLEGFPNVLLTGMCAWSATWVLAGFLDTRDPGAAHWTVAWILVGLKLLAGGGGIWVGWRRGAISVRWVWALAGSWALAWGLMIAALPVSLSGYGWRLLAVALMTPFARLAWCPVAMATNRCR